MTKIYQNKLLYPEILWEKPVNYYGPGAGRILVVAGSRRAAGKALLTCEAAFRSGTGILTLAFPEELKGSFLGILPESMTLALPQTHSGSLAKKTQRSIVEQSASTDLVIIGPGLSTNMETTQLICGLLQKIKKPLVIDGDGLRALVHGLKSEKVTTRKEKTNRYFRAIRSEVVVTPDIGIASKLLDALGAEKEKTKPAYIEKNREGATKTISDTLGATVVLKGRYPIVCDGKKTIIDKTNSPDTSNAEEDVLPGIIGSFLARRPQKRLESITTAVYLHSLAIRLAKEGLRKRPVRAGDIIKFLPKAIKISEKEQE